jgi:branched-chain amino acid transport system permease protein
MAYLEQCLIDGVLLGGIYVLLAFGLTLSFGVTRVVNFAHGEFIMVGAYAAFWALALLKLDPLVSLPLAMLAATVVGMLLFRLVESRILNAPDENQILLTFGLALILQNVALILWSGDERSTNPPYAFSSLMYGELVVPGARLIGCLVALILVGLVFLWLRYAELGRATRALAENREAAVLMGINVPQMYALAFGLSVALAMAAGAILSFVSAVTPFMGFEILGKIFAIVILGGLGSVLGSVIGALLLGLTETFVAYYIPEGNGWTEAVAFAVLFLVLIVRPSGIAGREITT